MKKENSWFGALYVFAQTFIGRGADLGLHGVLAQGEVDELLDLPQGLPV